MRHHELPHRFVEDMPEELEAGVLYVSMRYATAVHLCACGCGREVVTPLSPAQWKMTFDGETVSLSPSIGSWGLPCRSHYFITKGETVEALPWSDDQVRYGEAKDRRRRTEHYASGVEAPETVVDGRKRSWLGRLAEAFGRGR